MAMTNELLRRVLHIDDDLDTQEVVRFALGQERGIVVESSSGGESVRQLAASFKPDLILLDVMMPGLDGLELYEQLRAIPATSSTPVIFLTALALADDVLHYHKLGAIGSICKPFDYVTLASTVIDIWRRATQIHSAA